MKKSVEKEVKKLIKKLKMNCAVEEFKDKADWDSVSFYQKLSEPFIIEFQDRVNVACVLIGQELSEKFIRKFIRKNIKKFKDQYKDDRDSYTKEINKIVKEEYDRERKREQKREQKEITKLENLKSSRQKICSINSILSLEV